MSKRKNTARNRDAARGGAADWKRNFAAGALVVAVFGALLLAALLQTRPEAEAQAVLPEPTHIEIGETGLDSLPGEAAVETAPPGVVAGETPPAPVPPEPAAAAAPAPRTGLLTRRAAADLRRLNEPGGGWTLQFASMCDPDRVAALVRSLEGRERFYLVPAGDCYRIWWGRFDSREQALAAPAIPVELASMADSPFPRIIAESLP